MSDYTAARSPKVKVPAKNDEFIGFPTLRSLDIRSILYPLRLYPRYSWQRSKNVLLEHLQSSSGGARMQEKNVEIRAFR